MAKKINFYELKADTKTRKEKNIILIFGCLKERAESKERGNHAFCQPHGYIIFSLNIHDVESV